jgi:prolyl oligopeptidase PreP (S9A serine peptidase family)
MAVTWSSICSRATTLAEWDALYTFVGNDGPIFFFHTNQKAPRNRLVAIDIRKPAPKAWQEIIPEADETLEYVSFIGGHFVAQYLKDANSLVRAFSRDGSHIRDLELPGIGSVYGFDGHGDDPETFFSFQSYTVPPTLYRYDVSTGESKIFRTTRIDLDVDDYETTQVFYESRDGTRVPMFLTFKKGLQRNGQNPTLLYGYGGFNASITPYFRPDRLVWLERGGVVAHANLRAPSRPTFDPIAWSGWRGEGSSHTRTSGVAESMARRGTWLAPRPTSRMSSTTSSLRPSTSSVRGTRPAPSSPSRGAATGGCWWAP